MYFSRAAVVFIKMRGVQAGVTQRDKIVLKVLINSLISNLTNLLKLTCSIISKLT